ncbi:hypothetical protein BG015_000745 [Linnemannia schmuckeri]|uniref:FAD-binding domain-containing protein n=1 Tax=Linnemannia schmuckeri TaxID=64567 RepID=A0A9P5RQV1_9FUNG|nr:hypothetical protein BG015_000745 [Linnemannia schmuckeri]
MIVGAGLAGLLLALLLEKAGIPYQIYERAQKVKPLGGAMFLNASILPALEQLGLYDELKKVSLPATGGFHIYNSSMSIGYDRVVFPRAEFYEVLLAKIPAEKIHFSKKVMSLEQNKAGVMIRCADGTTYHGDILVGADGAHSGVRQALYKRLQKDGTLAPSDANELNKVFICMVGTTKPLDPAKYPGVDDKISQYNQIIGKNNSYCWGSETSEPMIKEVRDFLIPFGNNTLGDLIDATPRDNISRVFLEDKLFETWHHGRTVLIGDACHKLHPSAGLGAVVSMQDAVVLANSLYEMKGLTSADIAEALDEFKNDRYSRVKEQFDASKMSAKLIYGQSLFERLLCIVIFNWLPESIKMKGHIKGVEFRPQALFLPQIPVRGTGPVLPQKPSQRYQAEQAKLKAEEQAPVAI